MGLNKTCIQSADLPGTKGFVKIKPVRRGEDRIILLKFLPRLHFPFKVNENCDVISFQLIL